MYISQTHSSVTLHIAGKCYVDRPLSVKGFLVNSSFQGFRIFHIPKSLLYRGKRDYLEKIITFVSQNVK